MIMTVAEFLAADLPEGKSELVRGEVRMTPPPGGSARSRGHQPGSPAEHYTRQHDLGAVFGESCGYELTRFPHTVRVPNASFVRAERLPADGVQPGPFKFAPDLAIEVLSPSTRASELEEKLHDYTVAGTSLVWIVDPRSANDHDDRVGRSRAMAVRGRHAGRRRRDSRVRLSGRRGVRGNRARHAIAGKRGRGSYGGLLSTAVLAVRTRGQPLDWDSANSTACNSRQDGRMNRIDVRHLNPVKSCHPVGCCLLLAGRWRTSVGRDHAFRMACASIAKRVSPDATAHITGIAYSSNPRALKQ